MEPLDPILQKRLFNIQQQQKVVEEKKKPEPTPVGLEAELRRSIVLCRDAHPDNQRKKDNADYKLTMYILSVIEDACLTSLKDLRSSNRDHGLTVARAIFCRLERRLNGRSYPEVGALISKDHTSAIHMADSLRRYKTGKAFQVFMKDDRLRRLYECANKGTWSWDSLTTKQ